MCHLELVVTQYLSLIVLKMHLIKVSVGICGMFWLPQRHAEVQKSCKLAVVMLRLNEVASPSPLWMLWSPTAEDKLGLETNDPEERDLRGPSSRRPDDHMCFTHGRTVNLLNLHIGWWMRLLSGTVVAPNETRWTLSVLQGDRRDGGSLARPLFVT